MYKSILVPVDILEEGLTSNAISHAVYLAKLSKAKVRLFHVLPISSAIINSYAMGYTELKDQASVKAEEELKKLVKGVDLPENQLSYAIAFGSPRDEIVAMADEVDADLIVIASRRPNITTHLLGSNASGIVRYAKTSVLVVR